MTKTSPYISGAHIPGEVVGNNRNITVIIREDTCNDRGGHREHR